MLNLLSYKKIGFRSTLSTLASGMFILAQSLLAYTSVNPIASMVLIGFMNSLYQNTLWPSVPDMVEKKYIGLALGLLNCFQAVSQAVVPLLIAAVYVDSGAYIPDVITIFVILSGVSTLVSLYWMFYDYRKGSMFKPPALTSMKESLVGEDYGVKQSHPHSEAEAIYIANLRSSIAMEKDSQVEKTHREANMTTEMGFPRNTIG